MRALNTVQLNRQELPRSAWPINTSERLIKIIQQGNSQFLAQCVYVFYQH